MRKWQKFLGRSSAGLIALIIVCTGSGGLVHADPPNDCINNPRPLPAPAVALMKTNCRESCPTPFYDPTDTTCSTGSSAAQTPSINNVYILGDSITERSQAQYQAAFQQKGITANIDASSSRSLNGAGIDGNKLTGMQAIAQDTSEISQAQAIVVALGTNGGDTAQSIDQAIAALRAANANASIYWVDTISSAEKTTTTKRLSSPTTSLFTANPQHRITRLFPGSRPSIPVVIPKTRMARKLIPTNYIDNSDGLGVHPTPAGITALTSLVVGAVNGQQYNFKFIGRFGLVCLWWHKHNERNEQPRCCKPSPSRKRPDNYRYCQN